MPETVTPSSAPPPGPSRHVLLVRAVWEGQNCYFLPGGGQRPGGNLADAAHREVYEETGLIITSDRRPPPPSAARKPTPFRPVWSGCRWRRSPRPTSCRMRFAPRSPLRPVPTRSPPGYLGGVA
ncbi:NUDIX hydrolase [Streptomyces pini]|uniref:NUDIX domain-containing protein n=1 Tax=Streptomyces pini TaxID=1520580 RepID=UPI000B84B58E